MEVVRINKILAPNLLIYVYMPLLCQEIVVDRHNIGHPNEYIYEMEIGRQSIKFLCISENPTGSLLISFPHLKIEWRAILDL